MEKEFVTYELSAKLKELGFDQECFSAYRNTDGEKLLMGLDKWKNGEPHDSHIGFAAAPVWQQAFDWLMDKHGFYIAADHRMNGNVKNYWHSIRKLDKSPAGVTVQFGLVETGCYRDIFEARRVCLEMIINFINNK